MQRAIRCPTCAAENPWEAMQCRLCGSRLFAWLGDFFGARDTADDRAAPDASRTDYWQQSLQPSTDISTSAGRAPQARFPAAKVVVASAFVWVILWFSPLGAVVAAVVAGFLLVRWTRIAWVPYVAWLSGVLLAAQILNLAWGIR